MSLLVWTLSVSKFSSIASSMGPLAWRHRSAICSVVSSRLSLGLNCMTTSPRWVPDSGRSPLIAAPVDGWPPRATMTWRTGESPVSSASCRCTPCAEADNWAMAWSVMPTPIPGGIVSLAATRSPNTGIMNLKGRCPPATMPTEDASAATAKASVRRRAFRTRRTRFRKRLSINDWRPDSNCSCTRANLTPSLLSRPLRWPA